jgi:hypothetical protein
LRKNLLRDNSEFIVAPGGAGFHLTARLKQGLGYQSFRTLVAFRFLVGFTSLASIPKKVSFQGRDVSLLVGVSKWYVVFLTQQEVAQAFRNGFVSVRVSEAFDGSTYAVLDALECYACPFSSISPWMPRALRSVVSLTTKQETACSYAGHVSSKKFFTSSINALAAVARLLRPLKALSTSHVDVIGQLISDATVTFNDELYASVGSILESLGWDDEKRDSFREKSILDGCSSFLHSCQDKLKSPNLRQNWPHCHEQLQSCLKAASKVVAIRSQNDLTKYDSGLAVGTKASQFLVTCFESSDACLPTLPYLVELCRKFDGSKICC